MSESDPTSDDALARYGRSMRRQRSVYYTVLAALVAAVVVIVVVAWRAGEIAHTHLTTVTRPPATLALSTASAAQHRAWTTTDRTAEGNPQWRGTIVTFDAHTVRGRNARTGATTWSYTRTDRTVCSAVQVEGTTVAVYAVGGDCQEVTALSTSTGVRRWTRTLDENGQPLNGYPTYSVSINGGDLALAITSPGVVYDIDVKDGIDFWTYSHFGCDVERTVLGTQGALISQTCSQPRCTSGLKFCGRGPQLLLRSAYDGEDTTNQTNPNQIQWNRIGDDAVPVSADGLITAVSPGLRSIEVLNPASGAVEHAVSLRSAASSSGTPQGATLGDGELISAGGLTYLLPLAGHAIRWTATAGPSEVAEDDIGQALSTNAIVTTPTSTGVDILSGTSGRVTRRFTLSPAPPAGAVVRSLGSGFLVSSPQGTTAFS